jgi:hypothetical protein
VVKHDATHASIASANMHTTVKHRNSLVQYHFAMIIHAEMRWLRSNSGIVAVLGARLFNFY